jgi:eukaryotic translation initiation factor 2C
MSAKEKGERGDNKPQPSPSKDLPLDLKEMLKIGDFKGLAIKPSKSGILGRRITVNTNMFKIIELKNECAFHYDVKVEIKKKPRKDSGKSEVGKTASSKNPQQKQQKWEKEQKDPESAVGDDVADEWKEINTIRILRQVFANFQDSLSQPGKDFEGIQVVYDGKKNAFAIDRRLPNDTSCYNLTMEIEGSEDEYRITYQYTNHEVNLDIHQPLERDAVQALEVAFGHAAAQSMITRKQDHFLRQGGAVFNLGLNLELRMGVRKSIKATQAGYLINVDEAAAVFEKGGDTVRVLLEITNGLKDSRNNVKEKDREASFFRMTSNIQKILLQELKNFRVTVKNPKISYKRKYKIDGVTLASVTEDRFYWNEAGRDISIKDYYAQHYDLKLKYPYMPCFVMQNGAHIPIEICHMIPEQYYAKKLNERIQGQVTQKTIQAPNDRMRSIIANASQVVDAAQKILKCKVDLEPLVAPARVLDPPVMSLNRGDKVQVSLQPQRGNPGDYSLYQKKLHNTVPLKDWVMMQIVKNEKNADDSLCKEFALQLSNKAGKMGMKINPIPAILSVVYTGTKNLQTDMLAAVKRYKPQMLFMLKPNEANIYEDIKTIGNRNSIVTQCLEMSLDNRYLKDQKARKMMGGTFLENMILKMNAKLGGTNAVLDPSTFKFPGQDTFLTKKNMMVMGIDVAHPGVGSTLKHSIAGFVGSYTSDYTQYFSQARGQLKERQEVIQEWINSVEEVAIHFFKEYSKKNNGHFPQIVVVYRDGVSEGQFMQVRDQEVTQLQRAMKSIVGMKDSKLVYITVQKRHHFRMFCFDPKRGYENVKPGTVIDTHVVHPERFECYLNSHHALRGSSRSSHYCVIYNDCSDMNHDLLETMSYYLCFLCARCPKPISLPIPTRYAHLVCEKASMFLSTNARVLQGIPNFDDRVNEFVTIDKILSEKLFYA